MNRSLLAAFVFALLPALPVAYVVKEYSNTGHLVAYAGGSLVVAAAAALGVHVASRSDVPRKIGALLLTLLLLPLLAGASTGLLAGLGQSLFGWHLGMNARGALGGLALGLTGALVLYLPLVGAAIVDLAFAQVGAWLAARVGAARPASQGYGEATP